MTSKGGSAAGERHVELAAVRLAEFIEERTFFREVCGYNDRQIAAQLGMKWESYRRKFDRHPELGQIDDPVIREQRRHEEFSLAVLTALNRYEARERRQRADERARRRARKLKEN